MTTIHTRQLQQYTRPNQQQLHTIQLKTSNNTCETNYNTTCTEGKNSQAREYCVQFLVIVPPPQSLIHSSPSLLITYDPINLFHKDSPPPHSLYCTSLHPIPLHFASFTSLYFTSLQFILDNFPLHFRLGYVVRETK